MSEIAQAFVRIRPNTAGFTTEAEGGIRSAFSRLAKIAAAAFVIGEGVRFGAGIVEGAATLQKSVETISLEFGKAGDSVAQFGEKGATQFGISARLADATSARFGILFHNLGIGQEQAAGMTIGFEKLAGAISAIRGVDPSTVLQNLPLAAAGNTRGLKQLGIAIDVTQLKLAAFKLGLIQTTSQALTPAQKAQAIYAIATAHLTDFLEQARKHSHDLATTQRILSAEWSNAKDTLGAGLIPVVARVTQFFADNLPGAIKIVRGGFHDLAATIGSVGNFIAPAFRPIVDEIGRLKDAFAVGGIHAAIAKIKSDFLSLSPVGKIVVAAFAGVGAAIAVSFAGAVAAAAPLTATILVVTGLAIGFQEAYKRSAAFRDEVDKVKTALEGSVLPAIKKVASAINTDLGKAFDFVGKHAAIFETLGAAAAGAAVGFVALRGATVAWTAVTKVATAVQIAFDAALDANPIGLTVIAIGALVGALAALYFKSATVRRVINEVFGYLKSEAPAAVSVAKRALADLGGFFAPIFNKAKGIVEGFVSTVEALWRDWGSTIKTIAKNEFQGTVEFIRGALKTIQGVIDLFAGILHGDWGRAWKGLKEIVSGVFDQIDAVVGTFVKNLEALFSGMWDNIEKLFLEGVEKIVALLAGIPTKISAFGVSIGFTNPFKGFDEQLKKHIAGLGDSAKNAAGQLPSVVAEAAAKARAGTSQSLNQAAAKSVKDAADVIGRGADSAEAARLSQAAAASVKSQVDGMTTALTNSVKTQDAGISKARGQLQTLGQSLADAISQQASDVRSAVEQAKQNLSSIGTSLADFIGQTIDKPLQDAQNKISTFQNRKSLEDLRASILLPGGKQLSANPDRAIAQLQALAKKAGNVNRSAIQDFILQYQQAALAVKQDQANVTKEGATRRIADLTDALNRGKITQKQFTAGILGELKRDHVSFKTAGQFLGTAFANGFRDSVKGILAQAKAIQAVPASVRNQVSGAEPQLVQPLKTLAKDQEKIAKISHDIANKQTALQARIAKAAEANAASNKKIADLMLGQLPTPKDKNPGKTGKTTAALNGTTG